MEEALRRMEALEEAESGLRQAEAALIALGLEGHAQDAQGLLEDIRPMLARQQEIAADCREREAAREWAAFWRGIP